MFKYLVFWNIEYYPSPGMYGCIAKVNTIEEVISAIQKHKEEAEQYGDFRYVQYIQFYDIVNDVEYSVDVDKFKDDGEIVYDVSEKNEYI